MRAPARGGCARQHRAAALFLCRAVLGDGIMTAWFLYQLRGDADAAQMFCGGEAELLQNANWQDVQKNF